MTLSPKKRPTSDSNEFMPVTKRMNLLRIDNSRESTNDGFSVRDDENESNSHDGNQMRQAQEGHEHMQSMNHSNQVYSPSLNCSQNPIYYEANRILFEAHQMRITRLHVHKCRS